MGNSNSETSGKGKLTPQERYDKDNTQFVGLKLNKKSDKDILEAIEGKSKQTEIKRLIRKGLEAENVQGGLTSNEV